MPLRKFPSASPFWAKTQSTETPETHDAPPPRRNLWRTGLLLATSAAFGGIAVAIWNRRTLAQFRQHGKE